MTPFEQHDLQVAHDLGTLEGKVAAILDYTKEIPALVKKVERHDTQLRFIRWGGGLSATALLSIIVGWFRTHFFHQ